MRFPLRQISSAVLGGAVFLCVLGSGCGGGVQSAMNPTGPQAQNIDRIWRLIFYTSIVVFLLVLTFLAIAIFRHRTLLTDGAVSADLRPAAEGELRRRNVIIAATVITIVILSVFVIESFVVGRGLTAELSRKQGVAIELTGHQWWWEARYMNVDASSIFTTANELHIPVGVPVSFSLKASDVIHSFWVPNLSGKKDLIPGKIATIWLQADQPGVYRGQCAEYCGLQHAHMALWIIAEPRDQYEAWLNAQLQTAPQPANDSQKRGRQIFLSSTCVMCHAVGGTIAGSNFGPNLTHVAGRTTIAAGTLENNREHLSQWISNSQLIKPGNKMPAQNLSSDDLNALLDYVESLR